MAKYPPRAFRRGIVVLGLAALAACADQTPRGAGGSGPDDSATVLEAQPEVVPDTVMARDTATVP